jgi:hypothetical protein
VATPLPALADVAEVPTASDAAGFQLLLEEALNGDGPELRSQRSAGAAAHSWDARLTEIAGAIEAL